MMEPITLTAAKEICKTAKTIQKVYNVSREMKTIAEFEGKDQIMATKDLASTASKMKQEGVSSKGKSSNKEINNNGGDLQQGKTNEANLAKDDFVHQLDSSHINPVTTLEPTEFVDKLSSQASNEILNQKDVFVDRLSSSENPTSHLGHNDVPLSELPKEESKLNSNEVLESSCEEKPEGLTEQEKQEIKDKTGWSDKIVNAIRTKEEAQVYIDAGLVEGEINGKPALLQPNIDGKACNDPKWPDWNNKDLAEEGYPPRDKNGRPYELHHIGQKTDSPLAELTHEQHHSDGNFKILHTFDESSIDRVQFNKERKEYWSERSKLL